MTEGPMDENPGTHPDEGTIHAWLDDALGAEESASIASHVRGCSACAERVAEARGLIAGASRVVRALDDVPAGVLPTWGQPAAALPSTAKPAAEGGSLWRALRVTPARAAIAATLLVAAGVTLSRERGGLDAPTVKSEPALTRQASSAPNDGLLDSAVARRLESAQPPRTIAAAPGPAIPQAPTVRESPEALADPTAGRRVAEGRAAVAAQRETASFAPDRVGTGVAGAAAAPVGSATRETRALPAVRADLSDVIVSGYGTPSAAAPSADRAATGQAVGNMARKSADAVAAVCFEIASAAPGATWASLRFPFVVAVDPAAASADRPARLYRAGRLQEPALAVARLERDSVRIELRQPGHAGTIHLGPPLGDARTGLARSATLASPAEQTVATRAMAQSRTPAAADAGRTGGTTGGTAGAAAAAEGVRAAPSAPAPSPVNALASVRAIPISSRAVACPNR